MPAIYTDFSKCTLRFHTSIADIAPEHWQACTEGASPFSTHGFISLLENSGSACPETGWHPCHVGLYTPEKQLIACAPMYIKSHSYGEFVFDWAWADAMHRAGLEYYPKSQCAIPFTPVTDPKIHIHPNYRHTDPDTLRKICVQGMLHQTEKMDGSSLHLTFLTGAETQTLSQLGAISRRGMQYHWYNRAYGSFDDFLNTLSSRKRKAIRKERKQAQESMTFKWLRGAEITEKHMALFYEFYLHTIDKKWANAYLTRDFFMGLCGEYASHVVLILGYEGDRCVCGALNLVDDTTLYGRYWGGQNPKPFVHFETCYYQAIDYAIAHNLQTVEAGAQGEHKIQRGYIPTWTTSAHFIRHPGLSEAVRAAMDEEAEMLHHAYIQRMAALPYNQDHTPPKDL